jgi:hypothetical protein
MLNKSKDCNFTHYVKGVDKAEVVGGCSMLEGGGAKQREI